MWEYSSDGELYFEKAVNVFFPLLVEKWKKIGASHSVTIIMTSRTYFDNIPQRRKNPGTGIVEMILVTYVSHGHSNIIQ